jgi:SAM-dependent methyltransferase
MKGIGLIDRIFLAGCYPIPGKAHDPHDGHTDYDKRQQGDPLQQVRRWYGPLFERELQGKVFADFGCGAGFTPIGAVKAGAREAIGVEIVPEKTAGSAKFAQENGLPVRYVTSAAAIAPGSVDMVLSQNSFEHFIQPEAILESIHTILKPGGKFFVHFGPPWKHPYGLHHYFMVKWPWMHLLFSEQRFMRLRPLFRPNEDNSGKKTWEDTGMNRMTLARFEKLTSASRFHIETLKLYKVGGVPGIVAKIGREYFTSHVVAVLVKN